MADQSYGLRFDIYERVHLSDEEIGIEELEEIELYPRIQVVPGNDYATMRGHLLLTGLYRGEGETRELSHLIPVEITVPLNRVNRVEDIAVEIENFDVDLLNPRSLNVTGVLSLQGIETAAYTQSAHDWSNREYTAAYSGEQQELAEETDFTELAEPVSSVQEEQEEEEPVFAADPGSEAVEQVENADFWAEQRVWTSSTNSSGVEEQDLPSELGQDLLDTAAQQIDPIIVPAGRESEKAEENLSLETAQPPADELSADSWFENEPVRAVPKPVWRTEQPHESEEFQTEVKLESQPKLKPESKPEPTLKANLESKPDRAPAANSEDSLISKQAETERTLFKSKSVPKETKAQADAAETLAPKAEESPVEETAGIAGNTDAAANVESAQPSGEEVPVSAAPVSELETEEAPEADKPQEMKIALGSKKESSSAERTDSAALSQLLHTGAGKPSSAIEDPRPDEDLVPPEGSALIEAEDPGWKQAFLTKMSEQTPFRKVRLVIVQREETIDEIAERYRLSPRELLLHNRLTEQNLSEGQVLYIP
ncbi:hypothetical protein DCC85_17070 [Paenibacillus sp. CAA11]|uniref:LysM peptidoglycan-binding domain-containing protein n=1 Tax=Paenibacillus sp. CAA11 TaxID=1532905 RepID=UPI000D3367BD|nr:LysM peptidoglycan-binding domain-containing protein [Paenibacillus sp. CAA11]AWB45733.1 hypothetical protein DCC85_17070 [Paenibacillus sp. CAA11]